MCVLCSVSVFNPELRYKTLVRVCLSIGDMRADSARPLLPSWQAQEHLLRSLHQYVSIAIYPTDWRPILLFSLETKTVYIFHQSFFKLLSISQCTKLHWMMHIATFQSWGWSHHYVVHMVRRWRITKTCQKVSCLFGMVVQSRFCLRTF